MAKKQFKLEDTNDKRKELNKLLVSRSIEKTNKYDKQITKLESEIDFFTYGIVLKF